MACAWEKAEAGIIEAMQEGMIGVRLACSQLKT